MHCRLHAYMLVVEPSVKPFVQRSGRVADRVVGCSGCLADRTAAGIDRSVVCGAACGDNARSERKAGPLYDCLPWFE